MSEFFDYNLRVKQFEKDDFWRQVRRTINGQPVSTEQISLIVEQITKHLMLSSSDILLDLGCGNGALTNLLRSNCQSIYGIDRSEYLISVANEFFAGDNMIFSVGDIRSLDFKALSDHKINKALMYGVSSFISDSDLSVFIQELARLGKIRLFIGNVRDIKHAQSFFKKDVPADILLDTSTSMGKWRDQEWFHDLSDRLGLNCSILKMPTNFYAHEYYYDVLLSTV